MALTIAAPDTCAGCARAEPVGARRPPRTRRLPEVLTPDELELILAQAYRARGVYGLIVRLLFETGVRVSELVAVHVIDVDFLERTIRVREGKGGKDRLVLFTEDLGQQLRLHLAGRTRGALFESNRAAPFTPRRIQQIVRAVARAAGVQKRIHPHTYRHFMATFLRNHGVALDVVQLLLGHADPRTTQLYTQLSLSTARTDYDQAMAALAHQKTTPMRRKTATNYPWHLRPSVVARGSIRGSGQIRSLVDRLVAG